MHVAVFGPSGRTEATVVALILANGLAAETPTTLVRALERHEAPLNAGTAEPDLGIVEESGATDVDHAAAVLDRIAAAQAEGRRVVLDLPFRLAEHEALRREIAVALLAVGPSQIDVATGALAAFHYGHGVVEGSARPWLLGCGRLGGRAAALAFEADIKAALAPQTGHPAKVLPAVLPPIGRHDLPWLIDGVPGARLLELGQALVTLVDRIVAEPETTALATDGDTALDRVSDIDGLAMLADDIAAVAAGYAPTPSDLAGAPTLTRWRYEHRPRRVITGRVGPAPSVSAAKRIATGDLFASDGETWARSRTRWYRLSDPVVPAQT